MEGEWRLCCTETRQTVRVEVVSYRDKTEGE